MCTWVPTLATIIGHGPQLGHPWSDQVCLAAVVHKGSPTVGHFRSSLTAMVHKGSPMVEFMMHIVPSGMTHSVHPPKARILRLLVDAAGTPNKIYANMNLAFRLNLTVLFLKPMTYVNVQNLLCIIPALHEGPHAGFD